MSNNKHLYVYVFVYKYVQSLRNVYQNADSQLINARNSRKRQLFIQYLFFAFDITRRIYNKNQYLCNDLYSFWKPNQNL